MNDPKWFNGLNHLHTIYKKTPKYIPCVDLFLESFVQHFIGLVQNERFNAPGSKGASNHVKIKTRWPKNAKKQDFVINYSNWPWSNFDLKCLMCCFLLTDYDKSKEAYFIKVFYSTKYAQPRVNYQLGVVQKLLISRNGKHLTFREHLLIMTRRKMINSTMYIPLF